MWAVYGCNKHGVKIIKYGEYNFFSIAKEHMDKLSNKLIQNKLEPENGEQIYSIVISKLN